MPEEYPKNRQLKFKADDLVIKGGDYGISIYKIIEGRVKVYTEWEGREITLAYLGPGEVVGEMSFFSMGMEVRAASVRTETDSILEAWHPSTLQKEYENSPSILKYILDQTLQRLLQINKITAELNSKRGGKKAPTPVKKKGSRNQRKYYRKETNIECRYGAADSKELRYSATIKDLSLKGVGLSVSGSNLQKVDHSTGTRFNIAFTLPNGKKVAFEAQVVAIRAGSSRGAFLLGFSTTDISYENQKSVGFFLMP